MKLIGFTPHIPHDLFLKAIHKFHSAKTVLDLSLTNGDLIIYKATSYHHLPPIGAHNYDDMGRYWAKGLPDVVLSYFESPAARNDPIRDHIMGTGRPFWLSDVIESLDKPSPKSVLRVEMTLEQVGEGIVLPLYGPYHERAYTFMSFEQPKAFFDEIFIWQLQALLQAMHVKYCFIRESLRSQVSLTPRESDVLELITFGKTNPEIAKALGISTNTVTGYVKQTFLKLDVSDRVTAALRARSYHIKN